MDDLEDLQARVAAAQEKLRLNADAQRKYGLRLNDVVTIVEGSLARQQEEMKRLQDAAVALRLDRDATRVAESQTKGLYEAALARLNLLQAQNDQLRDMVMTLLNVIEGRELTSALQPVLQRLETSLQEIAIAPEPSEETLPSEAAGVAESASAPQQEPVSAEEIADASVDEVAADDVAAEETAADEAEAAAESADMAAKITAPQEIASELGDNTIEASGVEASDAEANDAVDPIDDAIMEELEEASDSPIESREDQDGETPAAGHAALAASEAAAESDMPGIEMLSAVAEDVEAEGAAEDMPEDLGEMTMSNHEDIVTDADEMLANEALAAAAPAAVVKDIVNLAPVKAQEVANAQQDETLVSALLDAEKALIEAGVNGVANVNSPVAEIIRRISLRTREFSEASSN